MKDLRKMGIAGVVKKNNHERVGGKLFNSCKLGLAGSWNPAQSRDSLVLPLPFFWKIDVKTTGS